MIQPAFLEVEQVKRMDPLPRARCKALCAVVYQAAFTPCSGIV